MTGRELALRLEDGTVIRDAGWRCVADVMRSFNAFVGSGGRAYGAIIDAETGEHVYPVQLPESTPSTTD